MKYCVVTTCFFAVAIAAPSADLAADASRRFLPALEHEEVHDEFGQYNLRYVTGEGTIVTETGRLVPTPEGSGYVMIVNGEVSYVGDDGKVYVTKYSAGLNGSHIEGDHLPVPVAAPTTDKSTQLV